MRPISTVHSFNVFVQTHRLWVHFARGTFTGFWKCEASTQDGRVIHSKLVTDEYMHDIWQRYHHCAEAVYFS
jgi:hypothetical protein